jgi:outer membrane protein TolC
MSVAHRITIDIILNLVSGAPRSSEVADVELAEIQIDAARDAHLPRISAELRGGVAPGSLVRIPDTDIYISGAPGIDRVAVQGRYGAAITLEQPLYDFGRSAAALRAAREARVAAVATCNATVEQRRTAAASAFYQWAAAVAVADAAAAHAVDARDARDRVRRLVG